MDVVGIIEDALRGLFGTLCEVIYPMIAKLYEIFIELGTLAHVEDLEVIYNKISLIIGIFMVFRLTFWLIESLVNPDNLKDKENNPGKIIQKVLISVVLLAITPTIFDYAFKLQSTILESGMIEKIISTNGTADAAKTGRLLSAELFVNFYTPNLVDGSVINDKSGCANFAGKTGIVYQNLKNNGEMKNLTNDCLTASEPMQINDVNTKVYVNDFNGLFATAVGIFVFWIILMYCISLGARYVQLIYLQVIAPIPIMCYLAPGKDNMFSKWLKQCTTTYLDVFIRVVIISFILVLCEILLNSNLFDTFSESGWVIKVFLILGLLTFAKKAPDLVQELLPKSVTKASGDFGLSWKKRTEKMAFGKTVGYMSKAATTFPLHQGKKIITGIDYATHGKGFWNGYKKHQGKAMQWVNKQRETLTPESYKEYKSRIEGRENVKAMNAKWNAGVNIAKTLINDGVKDWKGALDGITEDNYKSIFNHRKFRDSKMAVDRASKNEENLRFAQQAIDMGAERVTVKRINPEGKVDIIKYDLTSEEGRALFSKDLDTSQKILKGAETVHAEIRKQYQEDAKTEDEFKFIKNNEANPTNQAETHTTRGISEALSNDETSSTKSNNDDEVTKELNVILENINSNWPSSTSISGEQSNNLKENFEKLVRLKSKASDSKKIEIDNEINKIREKLSNLNNE